MSDVNDHTVVVRQLLAEHGRLATSVSELGDGDDLFAAGLTSHASVNLMLAIEDHYDLEFPETYLARSTFASIANLVGALDAMLAEQ